MTVSVLYSLHVYLLVESVDVEEMVVRIVYFPPTGYSSLKLLNKM